jgi:hypothetical protein
MSLETAVARISELQNAFAPPAARQPPAAAKGASFASMLQASGAGGAPASINGAAPVGRGGPGVLQAARGEIGVTEQPPGSNESPRIKQYRAATAGAPGPGPWCAYFVSWAAKQAGTPIGPNGSGFGSVDAVWSWAEGAKRTTPASGTPRPGDLIVWDEHIGIVESVLPNGQIKTIEGNSSDRVQRLTRSRSGVVGFVRMS